MRLLIASVLALIAGAPTAPASRVRPCAPAVSRGVLPVWARGGFSDARPRPPHVLGRSGGIAAILFVDPLHAPPLARRNTKILWVARRPLPRPADLRISAQRIAGTSRVGEPVSRRVEGGPGPSIVDLPAPGCWRLTLHWGAHADELDLRYAPRA
jgi:hypothetical protein